MPYKDPEKKREYDKQRRQTHKEHIALLKREWARNNQDKVRQRSRDRYHQNPDYFKTYYSNQDSVKRKARRQVTNRVRDGKIPHCSVFKCADCNNNAEHYHHENYSEWWSIVALCHACHKARHFM
jgi:hypothetical protein